MMRFEIWFEIWAHENLMACTFLNIFYKYKSHKLCLIYSSESANVKKKKTLSRVHGTLSYFLHPCSGEHRRRCCTGTLIQRAECQTGGWADGRGWECSTLPFSLLCVRQGLEGGQLVASYFLSHRGTAVMQQEQWSVINCTWCIWQIDEDLLWHKRLTMLTPKLLTPKLSGLLISFKVYSFACMDATHLPVLADCADSAQ